MFFFKFIKIMEIFISSHIVILLQFCCNCSVDNGSITNTDIKMNNSEFMAAAVLSVCAVCFSSCTDKGTEDGDGIRKPIAENITGKWDLSESYTKTDGVWKENTSTDGSDQTILIRTDGTAQIAKTDVSGQTSLTTVAWSADDNSDKLTVGPSEFTLLSLTSDEFAMSFHQAIDSDTGETLDGEFKWLLKRMDETQKTFAEKLVGKWVFNMSYEKKDGVWSESSFGLPDAGWYSYDGNGDCTAYSRSGDSELTVEMKWSVNNDTGELVWISEETKSSVMIDINEAGDELSVFYSNNFDPATGQVVTGEYKDILLRD